MLTVTGCRLRTSISLTASATVPRQYRTFQVFSYLIEYLSVLANWFTDKKTHNRFGSSLNDWTLQTQLFRLSQKNKRTPPSHAR